VDVLKRIRLRWVLVLYYAGAQIYVWLDFLTLTPGKTPAPTEIVVPAIAEIVTALLVAGWVIVRNRSLAWALVSTFNAVALLVGQFASWYVSYGNAENWSRPLTRLDGLGVALGTLTTAGAPGLTAHSETARSLITVQLVVDILAAIVLFGLFVGRLASRLGAVETGGRPARPPRGEAARGPGPV
jgi:hypothetical protein